MFEFLLQLVLQSAWSRILVKAQNDNAEFLLCVGNAFVAVTPCFCKGQRQKRRVNSHLKAFFVERFMRV